MSLTLQVQPRGKPIKNLPEQLPLSTTNTSSIYQSLSKATGLSIHRLRITKGSDGTLVPPSGSLGATGLRNNSVIAVKDLGPQISWTTVFLIEYAGPLLIHPLIYAFRRGIYSNPNGRYLPFPPVQTTQTWTLYMILLHFAKREFETLFVHRFSLATMPYLNVFKNSAHYWLLAGLNIAYWVYSPYTQPLDSQSLTVRLGLLLFVVGELGNLYTHVVLRNLRPAGSTERNIPRGIGFNLVTCPNYMFEAMAWIGICLVSWSWSTVLFTVVAMGQMGVWAGKKESRYRKEFGDKYKKKRSVMLPGVW